MSLENTPFDWDDDSWLEQLRGAVAPAMASSIGELEILEEVGRGGQGVVWKARQPGTGRLMALKGLLGGRLAGGKAEARFEREVRLAAQLNHPGIVTVYGVEYREGRPFLAMEWIHGESITAWAKSRPLEEKLACFLAVCDAVTSAHRQGIIHRDLKPSNLLVNNDGQAKVLDFGLAWSRDLKRGDGSMEASLTGGGLLGSPAYAAPEQLRGTRQVDERADVFSLGVILAELLTSQRTWSEAKSWPSAQGEFERKTPAAPSKRHAEAPRELDPVVTRAIQVDPNDRYDSVEALAQDLRRYRQGRAVLAVPPSSWTLLRKLVARNRAVCGLSAALLFALAGFAWYADHQTGLLERQRNQAVWEANRFRNLVLYQPGCRLQRADWNPNDPRQPRESAPEGIPPQQFAPVPDLPPAATIAALAAARGGGG